MSCQCVNLVGCDLRHMDRRARNVKHAAASASSATVATAAFIRVLLSVVGLVHRNRYAGMRQVTRRGITIWYEYPTVVSIPSAGIRTRTPESPAPESIPRRNPVRQREPLARRNPNAGIPIPTAGSPHPPECTRRNPRRSERVRHPDGVSDPAVLPTRANRTGGNTTIRAFYADAYSEREPAKRAHNANAKPQRAPNTSACQTIRAPCNKPTAERGSSRPFGDWR